MGEEELAGALDPHDGRPAGRTGDRHGTKTRQVTTPTGPMPVTMPRARLRQPDGRTGEWQRTIIPRDARRMRQVTAALLQVYLSGANTRRIRWA